MGSSRRGGVRLRITAVAVAAVTIVLTAAAIALLVSQRRILTNNLDELLATNSRGIEQVYSTGTLPERIVGQGDEDAIAQVVADGQVVASTGNLDGHPPLEPLGREGSRLRNLRLTIDESTYRVLSRTVGAVVIHTGATIDDVDESVGALRTGLVIAVPAVTALLGLLVWWLVGRTLRPVELIRAQVATISGQSLHRRVPQPQTADEIARLAGTMNAMLDRLEHASQRERQFVADASHELRSPLARMRTELEVDLIHPQGADLAATVHSVLDEVGTLQQLIDDLLVLAEGDAGDVDRATGRVDLSAVAIEEARRLEATIDATVETVLVRPASVRGNPGQLSRAIRNLLDNAGRHARSRIEVATEQRDGVVTLTVTDDGPGIPNAQRARVFERFARLDDSRQSTTGGFGLGLAITHDLVRRHGGTVEIQDVAGEGARFVVTLPGSEQQGLPPR